MLLSSKQKSPFFLLSSTVWHRGVRLNALLLGVLHLFHHCLSLPFTFTGFLLPDVVRSHRIVFFRYTNGNSRSEWVSYGCFVEDSRVLIPSMTSCRLSFTYDRKPSIAECPSLFSGGTLFLFLVTSTTLHSEISLLSVVSCNTMRIQSFLSRFNGP